MSDRLLKESDVLRAIDNRIKVLLKDPEFVRKNGIIDVMGVKKLILTIPSADRPQEWIPCSERLPKIGEYHISEPCIVYCKGGVYAFAELEENIFGQVGWNCERDDDYHEPIGAVVAWMPLPKPWKGADDDI